MIDRYTRPEMGAIWTLENRYANWLKVELAVCRAWNKLGVIDDSSLAVILEKAAFDVDRILEIEEVTRHDVIAFLTAVEENVGADARFIHLGCTSSDIVDTAGNLQLVEAGELLLKDFERVISVLKTMINAWRGQLCMGRTHGIHAEPTSFALKLAGFYAEFERNHERFKAALEDVRVGKISGAVGTYAFLSPELEAMTCAELGLRPDPISTQIIQRDRHAHFFTTLAVAAGSIERICVELRHLQRTEVLEVEEGFGKGQKGSSAMPHKKNPISAENLSGLARLVRTNALAAMENQALWHERDISHSSVERVIMPDSTILMDYALNRLANILEGLRVIPENMERNLHASCDLFYSQRVLTALINTGMPRQEAYVAVQKNAMQSWEQRRPFPDLVRADLSITERLDAAALDALFDCASYLAHENMILDRVLK